MKKSFWEENICRWKRTVGLWCCLMLGVVMAANSTDTRTKPPHVIASVSGQVSLVPVHATAHNINPSVTLSYSTLDVTGLNASAYGDVEF